MARTLLPQALDGAPELSGKLLPCQMEEYITYGNPWNQKITWKDLMRAFQLLVEVVDTDYKLFFFIDGLDKFQGRPDNLVTLIQRFYFTKCQDLRI